MVKFALLALVFPALASSVVGLNILLGNDDSWASANIRATFDGLTKRGHNVVLVAPLVQNSGQGGRVILPTVNVTAPGGEFGSVPVGAPFFGHDAGNDHIWYFNGTPAATTFFGLDVIVPQVLGNETIDLVVNGPNEGANLGPFLYTLSGTMGATYAAVYKGVPGVAFSAGNSTHRSFTTNTGLADDPANIAANLTANFVDALANTTKEGERILPLGVGINVNYPLFGPGNPCTAPPFILTRFTGGALVDKLSLNDTTGLPQSTNIQSPGVNTAFNGVKFLPGETPVAAQCQTSVSFFGVDYDAPSGVAEPSQQKLNVLFGHSIIPS
ncbi:sure-like protein [Irpex rosettiformis]|uniref:Sure-like protein n=1 Tax=Irpex rosettiformis TaxID=378272 RepID=A0ACB8TX61_9APHY|nr:sure-like protein [Irpex rosettiformis]